MLSLFVVLGDVGGLYGLLVSVAGVLANWVNFEKAEAYAVNKLY